MIPILSILKTVSLVPGGHFICMFIIGYRQNLSMATIGSCDVSKPRRPDSLKARVLRT